MSEQTARIIINFLKQLGIEVTTKVEQLVEVSYPVILRQVYVEMFTGFILFFVGILLCFMIWKLFKFINNKVEDQGHYENWEYMHMFTGLGALLAVFFIFAGLHDIVVRIINPQWYAAKILFDLIQNGGM